MTRKSVAISSLSNEDKSVLVLRSGRWDQRIQIFHRDPSSAKKCLNNIRSRYINSEDLCMIKISLKTVMLQTKKIWGLRNPKMHQKHTENCKSDGRSSRTKDVMKEKERKKKKISSIIYGPLFAEGQRSLIKRRSRERPKTASS